MSKGKLIAAASLLVIAGAAYLRIRDTGEESARGLPGGRDRQSVAVRAENPARGELTVTRSFTGELSGSDQAVIYSEAPGRLHSYLVKEGDEVKKDQVIALVDREVTGMDFEQLRVRSPINGTITRLYPGRGDTVSPQTPLAVAAKLDLVKASFYIPEKDLGFVDRGNPVIMSVTAYPEKKFSGRVSRISLSLERGSRAAYAEALFENTSRKLMPGMFASLDVQARIIRNALTVPENAVLRERDGSSHFVFTAEEGSARKKPVETGYRQDDSIQILAGISGEDLVIFEGQDFLEEGQALRIIK